MKAWILATVILLGCATSAGVRDEANVYRHALNALAEGVDLVGHEVETYCTSPGVVVETCAKAIDLHEGVRATLRGARATVDVYEAAGGAPGAEARRRAAETAVETVETLLRELEGLIP